MINLFFLVSIVFSIEPSGCINHNGDLYTISFCEKFQIRSIKKQKQSFSFQSDVWKGKRYHNLFVDRLDVYNKILKAIDLCNLISSVRCYPNFKLIEFNKLNSEKRVANAVVNFDGLNVVFGVVKKNNYYLVFPPSNFVFLDSNYEKTVFKYIIDLWKKEKKD